MYKNMLMFMFMFMFVRSGPPRIFSLLTTFLLGGLPAYLCHEMFPR